MSKKPDVYLDEFRPDYMPPAIPSDIAEELISNHKAPEVGVIIQNEFKMTRGIVEFEYSLNRPEFFKAQGTISLPV